METAIQINFNRPVPVFPLSNVVLLPHAVQHLHIFEDRYRQMISEALDGPGQIAMATLAGEDSRAESDDRPELRPAVCMGQIVQHHQFTDGRFNILLLGICRASIEEMIEPQGDRLYRLAKLRLLEQGNGDLELTDMREQLENILSRPRLANIRGVRKVTELFKREDVPTQALIELIGSTLLDDFEKRYSLLAEPSIEQRAVIVQDELRSLDQIVRQAQWQMTGDWPKGMSWN